MRIDLPGDFHPEHLFRYLSRSDKERLHLVEDNSVYKWVKVQGQDIILSISFHGQELQVTNLLGVIPPEKEVWVQHFIEEWWDLGLNLDEFYRISAPPHSAAWRELIALPNSSSDRSWDPG